MEKLINLPSGLRVKRNNFMLDFRYDNVRYRIVTRFSAKNENIVKATKLLTSIRLDLERNQFYLSNYRNLLQTPQALETLDVDYKEASLNVYMTELIDEQLELYKMRLTAKTMARSTFDGYQYAINLHLLPFFKNILVADIDHLLLEELIRKLPFTRKRVGTILQHLRPIFKKAQNRDLIKNNPMDYIDKDIFLTTTISSDYEVKPFSLDEIKKILDACQYDAVRNLIKFAFWTGMRVGEIFALQWSDIDFTKDAISVTKSSSVHKIIKAPKSKSGIRKVEMTPQAKEALQDQFKLTGSNPNNRIFTTPIHNRPWIKPGTFRNYWEKILTRAQIEYRNPHQMRHTFISYMLSIGNNPLILYRMVGHSDPTIMYKKYARFIQQNGGEKLLKVI